MISLDQLERRTADVSQPSLQLLWGCEQTLSAREKSLEQSGTIYRWGA